MKPKFELGEKVRDLLSPCFVFAYKFRYDIPPPEVIGIETRFCPCGCDHRWFDYKLSNGHTRQETLLCKLE
jgi:hypothetical protein